MEGKSYIFNLETTKIELHFEKADYDALTDEQKRSLKSAFLWSRTGKCWVSRAKEPNLWNAKIVAKELGFSKEQREGERLTFAEQAERIAERAETHSTRRQRMKYNGKEVFTQENFNYNTIRIGDYVEQAVVDDAMDLLPSACMSARCSQIGEPYSHREDPDTGKWRSTFVTFKKVAGEWPNGIWEYCGHCFCGETTERGKDPYYVQEKRKSPEHTAQSSK